MKTPARKMILRMTRSSASPTTAPRAAKKAKQLDREIPWRQLTELPRSQYEEYLQATRVEWMSWGGSRYRTESQKIPRAGAAYRDKSKGIGPPRPTCRVVIIGCQDPDIFDITRDSPAPTRLTAGTTSDGTCGSQMPKVTKARSLELVRQLSFTSLLGLYC